MCIRDRRISLAVGARLGADLSTLAVKIPADWWEAAAGELIAHAATGASATQLASPKEALIANYGDEGDFEEQQKELHGQRRFTNPVKDSTGMWVGRYAMTNDDYAALNAALDAGMTFIDTADVYGDGRSEKIIAYVLKDRGGQRPMVATKAGRRLSPHVADGYTKANLEGFIDRSLKNLGVERLDLCLLYTSRCV